MFRFDPNDIDPVVRSTDRRIRREALRQIDSVDLDDPDDRVEPLPRLETAERETTAPGERLPRSARRGSRAGPPTA